MPRGARLDAPGTLHHVMVRGIEKRSIVSDDRDRKDFLSRMGTLAAETQTNALRTVIAKNSVGSLSSKHDFPKTSNVYHSINHNDISGQRIIGMR